MGRGKGGGVQNPPDAKIFSFIFTLVFNYFKSCEKIEVPEFMNKNENDFEDASHG